MIETPGAKLRQHFWKSNPPSPPRPRGYFPVHVGELWGEKVGRPEPELGTCGIFFLSFWITFLTCQVHPFSYSSGEYFLIFPGRQIFPLIFPAGGYFLIWRADKEISSRRENKWKYLPAGKNQEKSKWWKITYVIAFRIWPVGKFLLGIFFTSRACLDFFDNFDFFLAIISTLA